jgi:hypothetical protein
VRTPSKLPPEIREQVIVHQADLMTTPVADLATIFRNHDAIINTAGLVTEGQGFVDLVARVVAGLESLGDADRPLCWFLAGAALLDLDNTGRQAVDFAPIAATYWPHRANFERIRRTSLDWRILCPGPMVDQPAIGVARMRISLDRLPVAAAESTESLPDGLALPLFVRRIPEMIVPYADAAALMLANLTPSGDMSRRRVGLALPVGMRGTKAHWAARPAAAQPIA